MIWALVAIAVVWLAVAYPGVRRLLAGLAGLMLLTAGAVFVWWTYQDRQRTREAEAAKLLIPAADVEPFGLTLQTETAFSQLRGRVRNNNKMYTLTGAQLRVRIQDCRKDAVEAAPDGLTKEQFEDFACDIVGEAVEDVSVSVPPGQVRDFDDYLSFPGLGETPPGNDRNWSYEILSVSGQR